MDPYGMAAYYGAPPVGYPPPGYPMMPGYPPQPGYPGYPPPGYPGGYPPPGGSTGGGDRGRGGGRKGGRDRSRSRSRSRDRGPKKGRDPDVHTALQLQMKKTKMCSFWLEGKCTRGNKCTFAHGDTDKASAPDLRKTALCQKYARGQCPLRSEDCNFAHGEDEVRNIGVCFKTKICQGWQNNRCPHGAACKFAHGKEELKELPKNVVLAPMDKEKKKPEREHKEDRKPLDITFADVESGSESSGSSASSKDSARSGKSKKKRTRRDYGPGKWTRKLCEFCCTSVATRFGLETCPLCRQNRLIDDNYQPDAPGGAQALPPAAGGEASSSKGPDAPADAPAPSGGAAPSEAKPADEDKAPRSPRARSPRGSSEDSIDAQL